MSVTLPVGLEAVFSVGHPLHSRIFWDKLVGEYYDMGVDMYLAVDELPRFGLTDRLGAPVVALHPAGWEVDTVTKYGKRCLRYSKDIDGRSWCIEQHWSVETLFTLFRWSDQVGMVSEASGTAAYCAGYAS